MAHPERAPRFVVRKHDPIARRRRFAWAVIGAMVLLVGAACGGYVLARFGAPVADGGRDPQPVLVSDEDLAQQVATLTRSEQVARIAAEELRQTLAEREEEISALRADLAFYSRLVGSGDQRTGISVHKVEVVPIADSRASDVTITLTQNARRGQTNRGIVRMSVEGVMDGALTLLNWDDLDNPGAGEGLPYAFKYFQQLQASVMLPSGFSPNRLRVEVDPEDGDGVERSIDWRSALSEEANDVQ